jgi:hypothetical protein
MRLPPTLMTASDPLEDDVAAALGTLRAARERPYYDTQDDAEARRAGCPNRPLDFSPEWSRTPRAG